MYSMHNCTIIKVERTDEVTIRDVHHYWCIYWSVIKKKIYMCILFSESKSIKKISRVLKHDEFPHSG